MTFQVFSRVFHSTDIFASLDVIEQILFCFLSDTGRGEEVREKIKVLLLPDIFDGLLF